MRSAFGIKGKAVVEFAQLVEERFSGETVSTGRTVDVRSEIVHKLLLRVAEERAVGRVEGNVLEAVEAGKESCSACFGDAGDK